MRMRGILLGAAIGTAAGITASRIGRWRRTWGIEPGEAERPLPGDDLVPDPTAVETRGDHHRRAARGDLAVARPDGLRPGGWYSYDQLDMRGQSATGIIRGVAAPRGR